MSWRHWAAGLAVAGLAVLSLMATAAPAEARGWMGRTGFAHNGHTLGTLRPPGYSEQAVCIDTDSDLPSGRTSPSRRSAPLLSYLMTGYSQTTSDIDAAALAYIVKEDLDDPGMANAKAILNQLGAATQKKIRSRIAELRAEAEEYAGPYGMLQPEVVIDRSDDQLLGDLTGIAVMADSGSLLPGVKITLRLNGPAVFEESGTTSLSVASASEPVSVALRITGAGDIEVAATTGKVLAGEHIHVHPSPKNTSDQRMVTTGPTVAVSAAAAATVVEPVKAAIDSEVSAGLVATGGFVRDTVRVTTAPSLAGRTVTVTTTAYGPLPEEPTETEEIPEGIDEVETLTAELELDENGDAEITLELSNRLEDPGWYVFVETVADDPEIGLEGATGTFGRSSETVLVYAPALVETRVSEQSVPAGATISDTTIVTGIVAGAPGVTVTLTGELRGPVAPIAGRCEGLDWSAAPIAREIDSLVIIADGEYPGLGVFVTPADQSGCYSYGETLTAAVGGEVLWQTVHPAGLTAQTTLATRPAPTPTEPPRRPGLRIQSGIAGPDPRTSRTAAGLQLLALLTFTGAVALHLRRR